MSSGQGRLAWNCRRGMKELDLLLLRYLDQRWPQATPGERAAFEAFLELPDPVIAGYLLGNEGSSDAAVRELVDALRCTPSRAPPGGPSSSA